MSPPLEPAGAVLAQIVADLLRGTSPEDAPVFAWPVICGSTVAARTRPLLFAGGMLRVGVPDAGWRTQLSELESRYVQQFNQLLGAGRVRRVEFVVLPPSP